MSPLSQKVNCLAGTQSTRIIYFRDLGDTTAAIIDRKWNEASDSRDVVARLLRSGGGMHIGFGRLFVLGDMTTGHPNLDKLAEGLELSELVVSLSPRNGLVSLVHEVFRFKHAIVTLKGPKLVDVTLQDVAVKVTPEGDVTFPPFS